MKNMIWIVEKNLPGETFQIGSLSLQEKANYFKGLRKYSACNLLHQYFVDITPPLWNYAVM